MVTLPLKAYISPQKSEKSVVTIEIVEDQLEKINVRGIKRLNADADLALAYVRAPINGQVLKIHTRPGESFNQEQGIVELGQTDRMMVIAEVYESDIGKVRVGQQAQIISESGAFSEKIKGTVAQIGWQIGKKDVLDTDTAADVDVRVVEVKILLNPEDSKIVSGLTYSKVIAKILL
ncbi:MAG: HlyD family efflux transporter periplasmic adaptor subunit [Moorea sp. SIO2B7]|nr:HlyD family efflux transporter periplasmic adaptor subunit [Moorena sp. SIO2B7]